MAVSSPIPDSTPAEIRLGIILTTLAALLLPVLDAAAKLLGENHGIPAGEIALARFALQALLSLPLMLWQEGPAGLKPSDLALNLFRGVLLALGSFFFFMALKAMPIADAIAIFFVEPMVITILSALMLGEKIGWRRALAVLTGFIGALIVIRPNFAVLGLVAILPALSAVCLAVYLVLGRKLSRGSSPLSMHFYAGIGGTLFLAGIIAIGARLEVAELTLVMPADAFSWSLMFVVGLVGMIGHLMFGYAYRMAPGSVLAPFGYFEIVTATLFGLVLFGDFPDAMKWLGIAIIIASGVYIVWRESVVGKRTQTQANTGTAAESAQHP